MIGSLLNIPALSIRRQVLEALHRSGFGDVTPSHEPVLMLLDTDGSRITALAQKAGITKQSIGYLVDQLERLGYVERSPDPADRRAQLVRRTRLGWAYDQAATKEVLRIEREWTDLLGDGRMQQLKTLLGELTESLGIRYEGSHAQVARRPIR